MPRAHRAAARLLSIELGLPGRRVGDLPGRARLQGRVLGVHPRLHHGSVLDRSDGSDHRQGGEPPARLFEPPRTSLAVGEERALQLGQGHILGNVCDVLELGEHLAARQKVRRAAAISPLLRQDAEPLAWIGAQHGVEL